MRFKRGNPIAWLLNNLEGLFGGVYFPVTVLPSYLSVISKALPVTYALRSMHMALNKGASFSELLPDIFILTAFTMILLPASIRLFSFSVEKSRQLGTLGEY